MTERLSQLLHDEAAALPVPPPPTELVLARGRRERRRSTFTAVAAAAAVAVIGGTAALALTGADGPDSAQAMAAYTSGGAWSTGSTVHFGPGSRYSVDIDGSIKAMYYTSAGVVVRSGDVPFADDAGPSHYALVTPDGDVRPLAIELGDRVPDTDPHQPYLAYAEPAGDAWQVVVRDVTTDDVVARHPLPDDFTWGGWNAPPVALVGDHVYVAVDDATTVVDWRTGTVTRPEHLPAASYPELAGDVYVESRERFSPQRGESTTLTFRDLADGHEVAREEYDKFAMATFSPGGSLAMVQVGYAGYDEDGTLVRGPRYRLYDMATGEERPLEVPRDAQVGWTPDDQVLAIGDDTVSVCDPARGTCEETARPDDRGTIRIAGTSYES